MKFDITNEIPLIMNYIDRSPTAYHAVELAESLLSGFERLDASKRFDIKPGGKYVITRGGSSLIAFCIPEDISELSFSIAAAHVDSPALKLKPNCEVKSGGYNRVTLEKYGGANLSSYFDRPLSVAGRVCFEKDGKIVSENVYLDREVMIIPSVPAHLGTIEKPSLAVDFLPLYAQNSEKSILDVVAEDAGITASDILSYDLFAVPRASCGRMGVNYEFLYGPRLDDLQCAFSFLRAMADLDKVSGVPVLALFNNEETGSSSREGAFSNFLPEVLERIVVSLGGDRADYHAALARSFMVSADNAHALHPAHPELFDAQNAPVINGGIVIKTNASQRYTTDAMSGAIVRKLCEKAGVPCQSYANRADIVGGSTLGNILLHQTPVCCADIGLAQLAMHSICETAGYHDTLYLIKFAATFFSSRFNAVSDAGYEIR